MRGIKKNRKKYGWTQSQLAEKVGVSINTIWRWEANQISPSLKNLKEMSKLFDCTIDELVADDDFK